jgi:hypothetical protein
MMTMMTILATRRRRSAFAGHCHDRGSLAKLSRQSFHSVVADDNATIRADIFAGVRVLRDCDADRASERFDNQTAPFAEPAHSTNANNTKAVNDFPDFALRMPCLPVLGHSRAGQKCCPIVAAFAIS